MILRTPVQPSSVNPPGAARAVIALGGGGARGLAHLGALQAVIESGFAIDRIVGTSIGSLVGGLVATGRDIRAAISHVTNYVTSSDFRAKQESLCGAHPKTTSIQSSGMLLWYDRIRSYLWARQLLNRVFRRRSLLSGKILEEVIGDLIPDIDISDTKIGLSIVAVDLKTGHQVVLEKGPLRKAILASAAIPGIFPPVVWDEMLLCDFGVVDSLPTLIASSYQNQSGQRHSNPVIVGVDVGPSLQRVDDCQSALHVLLRMDEIGERLYRRQAQKLADYLIRPEVGRFEWFDFSNPEQLIQSGLEAGRSTMRVLDSMPAKPHCCAPVHRVG